MSKTPFMPLWNGDLLADTMDLDATEVGAFMLLIIAQWQRKGASLPDDEKRLQRIARCGRNWPKVWARIEEYFERDDAGIFTVKGRELFQNVAAKTIVNARNGAHGGAAKALKAKARGLANASETLQRNASIPEPEPEKRDMGKPISTARAPINAHPKARLPEDWTLSEEGWAYARSQKIPDGVIEDEARGFHAYWSDRRDRDASKSARGWEQCWANRCRTIAPKYARGAMAGGAYPFGGGQGSSIASIVAQRRAAGTV